VVLTRGESALNIETMLERLKTHNPVLDTTQVFVVYKDFAEINAITKVLPQVQVQLCVFHVLKAIRKEVLTLVGQDLQRKVFAVVHSLVYARSPESFAQQWEQLKEYDAFHTYMTTSWLPICKQWALFHRAGHVTLGNTTNNRIESQFGKIKSVITSRRRLGECIRLLINVLTSADIISMQHQFADRCKMRYHNSYSGPGAQYFSLVTDYASRKVIQQISMSGTTKYSVEEVNSDRDAEHSEYKVVNVKSSDANTVSDSCVKCTCSFNTGMLLPCRHIFAARQRVGLPVFDRSLVAERWLLTKHDTSGDMEVGSASQGTSLLVCSRNCSGVRTLNQREKYNKAMQLTTKLAVLMSECGQYEFDVKFSLLSDVLERFETGRDCVLIEEDDDRLDGTENGMSSPADEAASANNADLSDVEPEAPVTADGDNADIPDFESEAAVTADAIHSEIVDNYVNQLACNANMPSTSRSQSWEQQVVLTQADESSAHMELSIDEPITVEEEAVAPDTANTASLTVRPVSPLSLKNATVPVARRCRGRPKGTDKSLNVKYGTREANRKRPARNRKLPVADATAQPLSCSASDNCAECGLRDPRKTTKRAKLVNWVQCNKCQFWYHECCISNVPSKSQADYVCVRCA